MNMRSTPYCLQYYGELIRMRETMEATYEKEREWNSKDSKILIVVFTEQLAW